MRNYSDEVRHSSGTKSSVSCDFSKSGILIIYLNISLPAKSKGRGTMSTEKKSSQDFETNSKAMREWKKKYYKKGNSNTSEYDVENVFEEKYNAYKEDLDPKSDLPEANQQHIFMNKVFISCAFIGGIFSVIGYSYGPDGCDNDGLFELLGNLTFYFSLVGIAINAFFILISLFDAEIITGYMIGWSVLHISCLFVALIFFGEGLTNDMFCDSGPNFYVTASPI